MISLKTKTLLTTALSAALMTGIMTFPAFAATKTMTSVTVRVGAEATSYDNPSINCSVWDSLDAQDGNYATVDSGKYSVRYAEWVNLEETGLKIGAEPEMKLYLQMDDDDFRFSGSYSTRTAIIKGGTLLSAEKADNELILTVRLDAIDGQYASPDYAGWTNGGYGDRVAHWGFHSNGHLSSGAYDVTLYRGSTAVKKLDAYQGTYYDFYPYMTRDGSYSVRVRTVPYTEAEKKSGKKSDWTESSGTVVSEDDVSDGTGKGDWILTDGIWYFRNPDQSLQTNSWFMVNTRWYLFDADGKMLTGFQARDGQTYYLDQDGAMATGWTKLGDVWYFFYPDSGAMAVNTVIDGYPIGGDGTWRE